MTEENDVTEDVAKLVTTKPEAEIAADILQRANEGLAPILAIFDEAARHGFFLRWDAIQPTAPHFRHGVLGLRIEKHYR